MYRSLPILPLLLLAAILAPGAARAQTMQVRALSLDGAKRMAAAAEAEALRNQWPVAIAVVDAFGGLVYFQRIDGTQPASLDIAVQKARTAARFKRPSKVLEDAVAAGRTGLLGVGDMLPLEGGIPVTLDGEVIGAIGVSGVTSQQDAQVAQAGLAALSR